MKKQAILYYRVLIPNVLPLFNNLNVLSNFHNSALDICKLSRPLTDHGNDQLKAMG